MKQYRFENCIETMISRLPSMFAYLEFNEDWTTTLHPATDSFNGDYGKVVENLALPCDVNLCTYIPISEDERPDPYLWNSRNTFPIGENIDDEYTINSSEYIRRIEGYDYREVPYSEYVDYEYVHEMPEATEDSPEHIAVPERDKEGNIIENCDHMPVYSYYDKGTQYTYYKKKCLLTEGETYTYRTLIDYYYRYKDTLPADNTFIVFMERGIGKVKVDKRSLHFENERDYPKVPDFIYLGEIKQYIEKYNKYKRICDFYQSHYLNFDKSDEKLEAKCNEYKAMGGDKFLVYLQKLNETANDIAAEYMCYSKNRGFDLGISLNVPLSQTKNDLGYLSTYINEFIPGEKYYHGDLLTYEGRTYICILNRFVVDGNNYDYVKCNTTYYKLYDDGYVEIPFSLIPSGCTVTEYCTGAWNDNLELNIFDSQHFVLLSEYIENTSTALGIPEKKSFSDSDMWYSQDNMAGSRFKIYLTVPHIPQTFIYENIRKGDNFYVWSNQYNMYIPDNTNATTYIVKGKADSVLKSLRSYKDFIDGSEILDEPDEDEDWLFYYKIGQCSSDYNILWDEHGNIKRFEDAEDIVPGQYDNNLFAYGTILTGIDYDYDAKTLTFTYVVNAHFKAILHELTEDDDGNRIYKYETFEYDENDTHGVTYVETYHYSDQYIDELIENGDFQAFVENRMEDIENYMVKYGYKRFAFSVLNYTANALVRDIDYEYPYVSSDFTEVVENNLDYIYQPLFKKDYFTGYAYEPTVENGVNVRRGNGSCFERHIRLSEVKTLNDMAELQNSSFFNMLEA